MTVGFFYAMLLNAPTWVPAIADSFTTASSAVLGQPITTDTIISDGIGLITDLWASVSGMIFFAISIDPEDIAGTSNPFAWAMLDLSEAQLMLMRE